MFGLHGNVFFLTAASLAASAAGAVDWTAGSSPVINSGESATIATPQPNIVRFTDNGTLAFAAGGCVALTGAVVTAVGSGTGENGALNMTGGSVTNQGNGDFVVGYLGGTGTVTIASGSVWRSNGGRFVVAGNEASLRDRPSHGEVSVFGLLSSDTVECNSYFPTSNLPLPYAESAKITLNPGGVIEAGKLQKNDNASATFLFNGGVLRARKDNGDFILGRGVMAMVIADDTNAVIDTNGKTIVINPQGTPYDNVLTFRGENGAGASGNGGLVKTGAGALAFRLGASENTFTGAIEVVAGTLDLGRPLAENQRVTVWAGASFVLRSTNDLSKITCLDGGSGSRMLYTVATDTESLDLTALNAMYYDDRMGSPFAGSATLSNALVHTAGTEGAPFRLIGQGGTLNLTNTTLETSVLQVEGPGTFNFLGSRTYASGDAGTLTITDGGYRQDQTFALADANSATPATLALATGRFSAGASLDVGRNGYGALAANGATVAAGRFRIGGNTGFTGAVSQAAGTITLNNESYVGLDGGSGSLVVTGGQFIVNSALRVASNPSVVTSLRPQGSVTVSNALLRCGELRMTSWWPTDGSAKTLEAGLLTLLPGGVAEVSSIYKNDDPISTVAFSGGLLRARAASDSFLKAEQTYGTLRVLAGQGQYVAIDTQGYGVTIAKSGGTLAVTGPGGLKKLGSGTLTFAASLVAYAGDTVVEGGVLRLGDNNQIPQGVGTGNVQIATNAVLDLNGKSEVVNRLLGRGRVISTNAPATLGVLADGSDDVWDRPWLTGPVTLDKKGAGTLTLAAAQALPTNLIVSAGTVRLAAAEGFPFYRFKIEGVKDPSTANAMQFSELALYNDGTNVISSRTGIAYDSTGGIGADAESNAFPWGETPEYVVDGIVPPDAGVKSKWLDFRIKSSRTAEDKARVWLRIDFLNAQRITHYNWATGNDADARDPAAWRLQGSHDGLTWDDLGMKTNYVATSTRNAWVSAGGFPVSSRNANRANILSDAAVVTVQPGATLALDGVSEKIGALAGFGAVALNSADLSLNAPAGSEAFFGGGVTGTGGLVKTGAGTQIMCGTNTYSGATIVQEGNLLIQGRMPFRWFRFTIMKNKGNIDVTQISELALYDADGQRRNVGLTAHGTTNVVDLAPGQFATPADYPVGSAGESADKLFDNATSTKWCANNNTPSVGSPATYRVVVMRLAASSPEITAYNLCTANDVPDRDPVTWTLEGSLDGSAWVTLDSRANVVPPSTGGGSGTGRFLYYNGEAPYALATRAMGNGSSESGSDVIPFGSVLDVRGGATLTVDAAEVVDALRVDMLSAGAITRLIAAPNGALYVVNAGGSPAGLVLPLTIGAIESRDNLSTWSVYVNGVLQNGVSLGVSADGHLRLLAKGTLVTVH